MFINLIKSLLILVSTILIVPIDSAQIISFNVTSPIENGTSSAILDCHFIYDQSEENLVMKWFHEDNPRPVYQWIVGLNKRSYSEEIRRHIDPDFSVNSQLTEHRAIRLIKPTTKLSGTYKCVVTSIQSIDSASAKLLVYAPAKSFTFKAQNETTITCKANGLYPSPVIELYRLLPHSNGDNPEAEMITSDKVNVHHNRYNQNRYNHHHEDHNNNNHNVGPSKESIQGKTGERKIKITKEGYTVITGEQGRFSIESSGTIDNSHDNSNDIYDNESMVTYQCHLFIPGTNYSLIKTLTITKGWNQQRQKMNGKSSAITWSSQGSNLLLILLTTIISTKTTLLHN